MGDVVRMEVCVSGGFDPLHTGHLRYLQAAAESGAVTVILNSDAWLWRKKGYVFLPWAERAELLLGLSCVTGVVSVDDSDGTVCEALQRIRPHYFANGGDRGEGNTPEVDLCAELGIRPLFGVGGGKVQSSSALVSRAAVERQRVPRPWGSYLVLAEGPGWKVKRLSVAPGQALSLQVHQQRNEHWVVVAGQGLWRLGDMIEMPLRVNKWAYIPAGVRHRLSNPGPEPLEVIEVQTGEYLGEDDIIRFNEDGAPCG